MTSESRNVDSEPSVVAADLSAVMKGASSKLFDSPARRLGAMSLLATALAVPALADTSSCWSPEGDMYCAGGSEHFVGFTNGCVGYSVYCSSGQNDFTPFFDGCTLTNVWCS
jgi:hypothetical protein